MTDQAAFLQAIIDEPDDDTHRLVFADWLDDQEQAEWARLIRSQCAQQRLLVPWDDPYTDPGLLPLRGLNDPPKYQVLGSLGTLFEEDLRDETAFHERYCWKLRRGMLEYVEVWGEEGVRQLIAVADRLFQLAPLADIVLRLYPARDGVIDYSSASPLNTSTLDRFLQIPQLQRLRNLDFRGISPLGPGREPRSRGVYEFAGKEAATRVWVSTWTGYEPDRKRLRELLGPRMVESAPHPDNPGDEIPF